jgi:methylmalonyl-CoA/ethylmalonyl-CoA epimerase
MYTLEHIGIAVRSLLESDPLYERLLGVPSYKHEDVAEQHVITSFFKAGHSKIELLEATDPSSPIHKFIDRRGEGIHHIAFEVPDIQAEMQRLKSEGFELLQEQPTRGADNKWVCFIHPRSANGVLVELCQTIRDDHDQPGDAGA